MRRALLVCLVLLPTACGSHEGTPDATVVSPHDAGMAAMDTSVPDATDDTPVVAPIAPMPAAAPLVQWVNPFVGTGGVGYGVGSAFPGPQVPFGMARPGPDSTLPVGAPAFNHCAGYAYSDTLIQGFSHTRMHGTGIADYGMLGAMPTIGMTAAKTVQTGYAAPFSHAHETASPGYYSVTLTDSGIVAELTATPHVALHRYTFPSGSDAVVLLDIAHTLTGNHVSDGDITLLPDASEIQGHVHMMGAYSNRVGGLDLYFVARFDRPYARSGIWQAGALADGMTTATGAATGAYVHFDTSTNSVVTMAVGLSYTDLPHARMNLDAEAMVPNFDTTKTAAVASWESALAVINVEGRSTDDFSTFYSALYHTLLMPTLASDVDGSYMGFDHVVHTVTSGHYYTDFSLWDTFRSQLPLMNLIEPAYAGDFLNSLYLQGQQQSLIPRWSIGAGDARGMIGEPSDIIFADAYARGLRAWDLRGVYTLLRASAVLASPPSATQRTREDLADYTTLGWVPVDDGNANVAETLEYAYADASLASLAAALGETADQAMFLARSHAWQGMIDPTTDFIVGRNRDGSLVEPMSATGWDPLYIEGDAWQYAWYVIHDLDGLATATGGRAALIARLNGLFTQSASQPPIVALPQPYYWAGNEPDIQFPWIFSALGDADDTAQWTRWILSTSFGHEPDGIPGNDDGGTMSAWCVLASLGMFPLAGSPDLVLGSPIFTRSTLHLPGGDFVITAPESDPNTMYITSATLNGMPLAQSSIPHATVAAGGSLGLHLATQAAGWGQP